MPVCLFTRSTEVTVQRTLVWSDCGALIFNSSSFILKKVAHLDSKDQQHPEKEERGNGGKNTNAAN